jgi:hypothetical protein
VDDLREVAVTYSVPGEPWQVSAPVELVTDLLSGHAGRKRAFLVRLLNGYSRTAAAAGAGVTSRAAQLWAKKDPDFAEAARRCEEIGFSEVVEAELYRRAFAGPSDPGSMRALELVARARAAEYRPQRAEAVDVAGLLRRG